MPLTFEQFKELRSKGLSVDQIDKFEGGYVPPMEKTNLSDKFMGDESGPFAIAKGTIGSMIQDLGAGAYGFANQAGFGLPDYLSKKAGITPLEPATGPGEALQTGAEVAGFLGGGPGRLGGAAVKGATKVIPQIAGKGIAKEMLKRGAQAGIAGASMTPEDDIVGLKERAKKGIPYALVGAVFAGGENTVRNVANLTKRSPQFAARITDALSEVKVSMGKAFQKGIQTLSKRFPDVKVDYQPPMREMLTLLKDEKNSMIKSLVNKSEDFKKLVFKDKFIKTKFNLRESQDIYNEMGKMRETLFNKMDRIGRPRTSITKSEKQFLDLSKSFRKQQMKAFGEKGFSKVTGQYKDTIKDLKMIGRNLQPEKLEKVLPGTKKIMKDRISKEALERIFPKELVQEMGGYKNLSGMVDFLSSMARRAIWPVGIGVGAYLGGKKISESIEGFGD